MGSRYPYDVPIAMVQNHFPRWGTDITVQRADRVMSARWGLAISAVAFADGTNNSGQTWPTVDQDATTDKLYRRMSLQQLRTLYVVIRRVGETELEVSSRHWVLTAWIKTHADMEADVKTLKERELKDSKTSKHELVAPEPLPPYNATQVTIICRQQSPRVLKIRIGWYVNEIDYESESAAELFTTIARYIRIPRDAWWARTEDEPFHDSDFSEDPFDSDADVRSDPAPNADAPDEDDDGDSYASGLTDAWRDNAEDDRKDQ